MVAPPYSAQYLHFGETATRHLKAPDSDAPDQCFDGVFCFYTPPSELSIRGAESWTLELIFVGKRQDRCNGMVTLLGETDRGSTTVGQWLDGVLGPVEGKSVDGYIRPMRAAVSYVVKVFLYMALKQARTIERQNYDQAMQRVNGLGVKKRAKLLQRMQSLYNGILVGPEALPLEPLGSRSANGMPPHWRRGHFRMQPHGPGKQERKLIFVAPVLIHADQLQGEAPLPKPYRAAAIAVTTSA
jgi:hypothetical protein